MTNLNICTHDAQIQGFDFQKGFVALTEDESGKILAATSGWTLDEDDSPLPPLVYVYRPRQDGTWGGSWEGDDTFPATRSLIAIRAWQRREMRYSRRLSQG